MNIIEKRTRVRELKKAGIIPASMAPAGVLIAAMTNEEADALLAAYDTESPTFDASTAPQFERGVSQRELETPTPAAPKTNGTNGHAHPQPAPAGDLAAMIAAAVAPFVTARPGQSELDELKADYEDLQTRLAAHMEETARRLAERTGQREIVVTLPDQTRHEIARAHYRFPDLLTVVSLGIPAYLPGPAGSFKTSTAHQVAEALGMPFSSISVCAQTTQVALFGYMNAAGEYVTTEFRKRYEEGGIFLLDEMDNGNANVLSALNSAISNGHCAFPDGMIARHPDFRLIATANTYGNGGSAQYVGRCQLDAATLDRFAFLQWEYDEQLEELIATGSTTLPNRPETKGTTFPADQWPEKVRAYRAAAASLGSRLIISPRATFHGCKLLAAGMSLEAVKEAVLWKGTSPEERQKIESRAV